jgi:hypothetical protein
MAFLKETSPHQYGEQPIEASYMMHALDLFYKTFGNSHEKEVKQAFDWFLGESLKSHHVQS